MSLVLSYWLSITLRFYFLSTELFLDRVEISSPLTSYKRLTEGVALKQLGVDPYEGETFHETPLMLKGNLSPFHKFVSLWCKSCLYGWIWGI
jgi:hypothetical protein